MEALLAAAFISGCTGSMIVNTCNHVEAETINDNTMKPNPTLQARLKEMSTIELCDRVLELNEELRVLRLAYAEAVGGFSIQSGVNYDYLYKKIIENNERQ